MSYVKKYEVGSVRLDAPYAHYIYELPLLSFSDIRNSIGLSLVYQSKLNDNPFYIKNGFKLNLQKRLIMAYSTYPKNYEDCDGTLVSLNNFVNHFTFNDDSQRIIRYINGQYVLENPDLSTEIYNSSGKIIAIKDKYGSEYLTYTYTSGKLTSINYRNSKYINLSYYTAGSYSGQLERIDFVCGETSVSTTFIYSNSGIKIQHYSGVDYHFVFSGNTLTSYSTDRNGAYSNTYSHKLTCTLNASNHQIVASAYIGEKEVDRNTYDCLGVNSQNKFMAVNTKDFNGVITRVQYENDKPRYSYEITDTADKPSYRDIFFEDTNSNFIYKGNVSINTDTLIGIQSVNSGYKMTPMKLVDTSMWKYNFSGTGNLYGNFIISGWIYAEENEAYTVTVKDIFRSVDYEGCTLSNLVPNVWNYFSFKTYMRNPAEIAVKIEETSSAPLCYDIRISFEEGKVYTPTDYNNFTVTKDVLIKEGADSSNAKIIYFDNALRFYNGNEFIIDKITASDILKYKINQNKNRYLDELCYDKCKGISTGNGAIFLEYDEDVNGATQTTRLNVNDIAVGKVRVNNEKTYLTKMNFYTDSNGENYFATVTYINGEEIGREIFDEYFDIASSTIDSVTTAYTRRNGLITSESVQNLYTRTTTYSEDAGGNPTIAATDEFDNTTVYTLDPVWGVVKSVTLPGGEIVTDEYDGDMCAKLKRTFGNNESSNIFSYSNGYLSRMQMDSLYYDFTYSGGDLFSVSKNGVRLEEHNTTNTQVDSYYPSELNNLYSISSTYDKYGRLSQIVGQITNTYDLNPTYYSNSYHTVGINNGSSKLAKSTDLVTGEVTKYAYDNNRVSRVGVFSSSGTKLCEEVFTYDSIGRIEEDTCTYDSVNSKSVSMNIQYTKEADEPAANSMVEKCTYKIGNTPVSVATNGYDAFRRLTSKSVALGTNSFSTILGYDESEKITVTDKFASTTLGSNSYHYDNNRRLKKVDGTYSGAFREYEYDSLGRLVRENNKALDKTFVYCYDSIGNITSVKSYSYTTTEVPTGNYSSKTFTCNGEPTDRLTKYGYEDISYNSIGYPTRCGERAFVWNKGKLVRLYDDIDENSSYSSENIGFTYNAYGLRTSKVYQYDPGPDYSGNFTIGITTTYHYDQSGRLIKEISREDFSESASIHRELIYLYDEFGIIGVSYIFDGTTAKNFYYRKNLQGDVVAIYDSNGVRKVEYAYDAFGNCKIVYSASGTDIASINPIRYRGYYYDTETQLYYLNARYYNPQWRRFISPDSTEYIDSENPNGLNLYAYCNNDPINYVDPSGHSITLALIFAGTFAVGFGSSLFINAATNNWELDWRDFAQAGIDGLFAVAGTALAMTGISVGVSIGLGAAMGWSQYAIGTKIQGGNLAWSGSITAIAFGAIGGRISGAGATNVKNVANHLTGLSDDGFRAAKAIATAMNRRMAGQISKRGFQGVINLYGKTAFSAIDDAITITSGKLFKEAARNLAIYTPFANMGSGLLNYLYNLWGCI